MSDTPISPSGLEERNHIKGRGCISGRERSRFWTRERSCFWMERAICSPLSVGGAETGSYASPSPGPHVRKLYDRLFVPVRSFYRSYCGALRTCTFIVPVLFPWNFWYLYVHSTGPIFVKFISSRERTRRIQRTSKEQPRHWRAVPES
jgi:hypothetical protein